MGFFTSSNTGLLGSGTAYSGTSLQIQSTGTRTANRGAFVVFRIPQTNPSTSEDMGYIGAVAADSTSGNRRGNLIFSVRDTTVRDAMMISYNGNAGIGAISPIKN